MEKIFKMVSKNIKYLIVFLTLIIIHLQLLAKNCDLYKIFKFDNQALFIWEYASSKGFILYRDVFYPYGFLPFFRNFNIFYNLIYFIFFVSILTLFFFFLKKLYKNMIISYVLFILFVIYIDFFIGPDSFIRYGSVPAIISFLVLSQSKNIKNRILFLCSVMSGVLFSVFNDAGTYLLISLSFFIISHPLISNRLSVLRSKGYYVALFIRTIIILFGFCLGIIPLLFFLLKKSILGDFINQLFLLSNYVYVAKIPFPPALRSIDNFFVLGFFLIAISSVLFSLMLKKTNKNIAFLLLQTNFFFYLFLIEQKNVLRSIDIQLSFLGLILVFILFSNLNILSKNNYVKSLMALLITMMILVINYLMIKPTENSTKISANSQTCTGMNVQQILKNDKYLNLKKTLLNLKADKVFSYPGDPVIYAIMNQRPPFYPTVYEASIVDGQNKEIKYLQDNNIEYVVVNTKILSIQDSVPDYLRVPIETRFIFNNYYPFQTSDDFLILRKNNSNDFFDFKFQVMQMDFRRYLINVNLESIPISEGIYKKSYLKKNDLFFSTTNTEEINSYLGKRNLSSKEIIMLLLPINNSAKNFVVQIKTKDLKETIVTLKPCNLNQVCLVDFGNIPLFYKSRILKEIIIKNFQGKIKFYKISDNSVIW